MMDKQAAIAEQGDTLRKTLKKAAAEQQYNIQAARHNAFAKAAGEEPIPYKTAAFRELIRQIDSLVDLSIEPDSFNVN